MPYLFSNKSTQSPSPARFFPAGVNCLVPLFVNGEPLTSIYWPVVGSYQRAGDGPESFDMSMVIVRIVGMYTMINVPSGLRAAVA